MYTHIYIYVFSINETIQMKEKNLKKGDPTVFTAATLSKDILCREALSEDIFKPGRGKKKLYMNL